MFSKFILQGLQFSLLQFNLRFTNFIEQYGSPNSYNNSIPTTAILIKFFFLATISKFENYKIVIQANNMCIVGKI